jgi:hypothetical protein
MARGSRSCWQIGRDGDYPCFPAVPACSSLACTFPWTKKSDPLHCRVTGAQLPGSGAVLLPYAPLCRKGNPCPAAAGTPANHAAARSLLTRRRGRPQRVAGPAPHLPPGRAEPGAVPDPGDRADRDAHFPAAPQVPFLASAAQSSGAGNFPCEQKARRLKALLRTQVDAGRFTRRRTPGRSFFDARKMPIWRCGHTGT